MSEFQWCFLFKSEPFTSVLNGGHSVLSDLSPFFFSSSTDGYVSLKTCSAALAACAFWWVISCTLFGVKSMTVSEMIKWVLIPSFLDGRSVKWHSSHQSLIRLMFVCRQIHWRDQTWCVYTCFSSSSLNSGHCFNALKRLSGKYVFMFV